MLQGSEEQRGPITSEERQRLKQNVEAFVTNPDPEALLPLRASMLEMREVLSVFKEICLAYKSARELQTTTGVSVQGHSHAPCLGAAANKGVLALQDEMQKLRLQVQQRDNEITILVSMLKKHAPPSIQGATEGSGLHSTSPSGTQKSGQQEPSALHGVEACGSSSIARSIAISGTCTASERGEVYRQAPKAAGGLQEVLLDVAVLRDRNHAFELFRKSYRRNAAIENSTSVRSRYLFLKCVLGQHV
jgi:kinesin family member 6/9